MRRDGMHQANDQMSETLSAPAFVCHILGDGDGEREREQAETQNFGESQTICDKAAVGISMCVGMHTLSDKSP